MVLSEVIKLIAVYDNWLFALDEEISPEFFPFDIKKLKNLRDKMERERQNEEKEVLVLKYWKQHLDEIKEKLCNAPNPEDGEKWDNYCKWINSLPDCPGVF